jgi:hypothetical protein
MDDISPSTAGSGQQSKPDLSKTDKYQLRLSPETGVLHSQVFGYWNVDDAVAYIAAMKTLIVKARLTHGRARLLVDRTRAQVQSHEVAELLRGLNSFLNPDDRLAMIVNSTLAKMQLERVTVHKDTVVFTSYAKGLAWLMDDTPRGD